MKMNLQQLIKVLDKPEIKGNVSVEISGIQSDSRKVESGCLFVAVRGTALRGNADRHDRPNRNAGEMPDWRKQSCNRSER